jgi:hypothetical protein
MIYFFAKEGQLGYLLDLSNEMPQDKQDEVINDLQTLSGIPLIKCLNGIEIYERGGCQHFSILYYIIKIQKLIVDNSDIDVDKELKDRLYLAHHIKSILDKWPNDYEKARMENNAECEQTRIFQREESENRQHPIRNSDQNITFRTAELPDRDLLRSTDNTFGRNSLNTDGSQPLENVHVSGGDGSQSQDHFNIRRGVLGQLYGVETVETFNMTASVSTTTGTTQQDSLRPLTHEWPQLPDRPQTNDFLQDEANDPLVF